MTGRQLPIVAVCIFLGAITSAVGQGAPSKLSMKSNNIRGAEKFALRRMTLDQKIGQMLMVQFSGPAYSPEIATMIRTYRVGGVIFYASNGNIKDADQLHGVIVQLQRSSNVPLLVAIDQEGGYVDRLAQLNGRRPSAASIAETDNPAIAKAAGLQDARDLSAYGFNLNLAPVVDVSRAPNPQLVDRTFGDDPRKVTRIAGGYLQGLQQSGEVFGVLKHFPGLGGVSNDPHQEIPVLMQTQEQLEAVDWLPYRTLIDGGQVHAVMVTHEVVRALDPSTPATLSRRLITDVLRTEMHFGAVVITDSLSMEGIKVLYSQPQSAVMAIRAGADLLMGAANPSEVSEIIAGIKRAITAGTISERQIDASVRRLLAMKAALGLLYSPGGDLQETAR